MIMRAQQNPTYHALRLTEMKKLFWERSFDSVAADLVSIFIPIYLLRLGYPIQQVFLLYAITGLFMTLLYTPGFLSVVKIGANRSMVIGNVANALFFVLLYSLPELHEPLWIIAVFRGMYSAFYYPAFTANFVAARAHQQTGTQIGLLNSITLALNGLAPAVGGIIASIYGIHWVYPIVVAAIVIANVPLLIGPETLKNQTFNLRRIPWGCYKDFIANGVYNIPGFVEVVIWPITISLFVVTYGGIGVLSSILIISSITISLYVGRRQDRLGERRYINQGVASGAIGNLAKLFATSPVGIIGVNFISGTSDALLADAFTARYYKNADNDHMLEYTFGMEVTHSLVWMVYFGLLTVLAFWLSMKLLLAVAIILAIPALFGVRLIRT